MSSQSHTPHVLPLRVYIGVGAALFLLTAITVAVAQVDLGELNIVAALAIAILKSALVGLFFMHLLWDNKLYLSVFLLAVVFLGIFIIFTMLDTMRRGDLYQEVARPIKENAVIYDSLKSAAPGGSTPHSGNGH